MTDDGAALLAKAIHPQEGANSSAAKMEWLSDVAALLPDPSMRQRFLLRVAAYGSQVDLDEPLWGMLDILGLTALAYRSLLEEMKSNATAVEGLGEGIRAALDMVDSRLKAMISSSTEDALQLLEDVRSELREATSPEDIAKSFTDENQKQFALVSQKLLEEQFTQTRQQLVTVFEVAAKKLQVWVDSNLNDAATHNKEAIHAAVEDLQLRLFRERSLLIWSAFCGGLIAAVGLFLAGYLAGRH